MESFGIERRLLVQCWPSPEADRMMRQLADGLLAKNIVKIGSKSCYLDLTFEATSLNVQRPVLVNS